MGQKGLVPSARPGDDVPVDIWGKLPTATHILAIRSRLVFTDALEAVCGFVGGGLVGGMF